jgi:hypothetical protein
VEWSLDDPLPTLCPVIPPKTFWKGTTHGSFQQSLVEIGSVVSEKKIFFLISSLHFSIFSLVAILVGSRDHRKHILEGSLLNKN